MNGESDVPRRKKPTPSKLDLAPDVLSGVLERGAGRGGASAVMLAGLLSDGDGAGEHRLYLDYELHTFVVLAATDVLHRERTKNAAGVEVSILWVRKEATIEVREMSSEKMEAEFLSRALAAVERGQYRPAASGGLGITPTIETIPIVTALLCTKIFCTNATCSCTARHSLVCSIVCTEHTVCPNPWTKNWFCNSAEPPR